MTEDEIILTFSHGKVKLNEEQYRVVSSPLDENQRILASAGSGKTTTITARIAYLVEYYDIPPNKIILMTFSRAAAKEMIERVHRLIGPVQMYAGTFHGLASQILREHAPDMLDEQPFIDELPHRLVQWLETPKGRKWVLQFRSIIVDEFQDINQIQWRLLERLQHRGCTMSIVGDDAQNIYTWRGSSVDFILNFHKRVYSVKDYQLRRNYRSSESIVTCANATMRFIPTLSYKEKMVAHKRGGSKPCVHFFYRTSDEYDWIVKQIESEYNKSPKKTFAILSRYNHDLFKIEERLHRRGLPYLLCTQFDPERQQADEQIRITLATIHASKGLEWDTVYFMNLLDDTFPSRKTDEEIVCERRLFYVGITRARSDLYLTYSKQERSLSRFVREIPRPYLQYHNVSAFKNSDYNGSSKDMTLGDMIGGLDGDDWHTLRQKGVVPSFKRTGRTSIYGFGEFYSIPEWVKTLDIREMWNNLIRWTFLRECAVQMDSMEQLRTAEVEEALLTLRIYKEDLSFWEQHEVEMERIVHYFLQHTQEMKAVEYWQIEEYIKTRLPHLSWTEKETVQATVIVAKIRGQLRPLRHGGYNLKEFSFGYTRNSVPTELRPFVLKSWHRINNKSIPTHHLLPDLWRIASLTSVLQGRNIPLYQIYEVTPYFNTIDVQNMMRTIELAVPTWISEQQNPYLSLSLELDKIQPLAFDIVTDTTLYQLFFDSSMDIRVDDKITLLMKQYLYEQLYDTEIQSIGFINIASGTITTYAITSLTRTQMKDIWQYIKAKYDIS